MTGNKTPLQSTLLSPTSSKPMAQYIVKTNLNHHYNKLQNAKARIDNSLPDSMLKSQKVRDRRRQESRPNSSRTTQRTKSSQSSRPQSQFSNYGNSEEYWMGKYGDDLEAEVERIVQMTLNGKRPDLQQAPLFTQNTQDFMKQTNSIYEETARTTSRSGRTTSQLGYSARSFLSTSERLGTSRRAATSARKEDADLINTRAHVFTEPEKPFQPKILKSNRSSLLNQYKYYNPPKQKRPKQPYSDVNSSESSPDLRETGKGEAPVPKPRQKANLGNTTTLSPKKSYQGEEYKRVPPLQIPDDEDQREDFSRRMTSPKKSTPVSSRDRIKLIQSQSTMDLPKSPESLNQSRSLTSQGENSQRGKYTSLNSERSSRSTMEPKWDESDHTAFMKEVTEDILMKGLYTSRSIQRVFESHMRKRKGQLSEDEMKKMLTKLQNDIGISQNEIRESSNAPLASWSHSAKTQDSASPRIYQNGNSLDQDGDLLSTQMLKEYEEKLIHDETSPLTSDVQRSNEIDVLDARRDGQEPRVQKISLKNESDDSKKPGNNIGVKKGLVEEKKNDASELSGTEARKPVPRPRPKRRTSTSNLVSNVSSSDLPSVHDKSDDKSDFKGEKITGNTSPISQPEKSNGISSQNSVISAASDGGTLKKHPIVPEPSPRLGDTFGLDSKPDLIKMKQNSPKSGNSSNPSPNPNLKADQKEKPTDASKPSVETNYDDDFEDDEDDDDDIIGDSDSDF